MTNHCQYTGIELTSKRMKNSPEVTQLLNDANRNGKYSQVVEAMTDAKRDGKAGNDVLEIGKLALKNGYTSKRDDFTAPSMIDLMENNR